MRTSSIAALVALAIMFVGLAPARAADDAKPAGPPPWVFPQDMKCAGRRLTLQEPQVVAFDAASLKVSLRFAAQLTDPLGRSSWGVAEAVGSLHVDIASRLMRVDAIEAGRTVFPAAAAPDVTAVQGGFGEALPKALVLRLELLVARPGAYAPAGGLPTAPAKPPAIIVRERPAVLVQIDGDPVLQEVRTVSEALPVEYLANSASDVFRDPKTDMWYVLVDGTWMQSKILGGPWKKLDGQIPMVMTQLPADHPRGHVRKYVPGTPEFLKRGLVTSPKEMPEVIVTNSPTELLLLAGDPLFRFVPRLDWRQDPKPENKGLFRNFVVLDKALMAVVNTESDLFFHPKSNLYYLLLSGRWFSAEDIDGPWTDASKLPEEFGKIPRDDIQGHVVWCVPGTPEATEACALAALEERATFNKGTPIQVLLEGKDPVTAPLEGDVKYVTNTEDDCFVVGGAYYVFQCGVWYRSENGREGWKSCAVIPDAVRKLSEASGFYHVDFCRPLGIEGELANFAVTGAFYGTFASRGAPVYGTGTTRRGTLRGGNSGTNWYPCARTYGENRWYDAAAGVFQPRSVKPRANGTVSADEWSPYTASYGRVQFYASRYNQGGRRMFLPGEVEGTFDLAAARPNVWGLWRVGEELKKREGLDLSLFPFGDRSAEMPPVDPRIVAEESGKVWRVGAKGTETFDKGEWTKGVCPPDVAAWLATVARLDERPAVWKRWREQRAAAIPVNPVVTPKAK